MNAMDKRAELMTGCRQLAASAWCDRTTSHIVMIPALAEQFAKILYATFQANAGTAPVEQHAPVEQPAREKIGLPSVMRNATANQPTPAPNCSPPIWELVIEDMKSRDRVGRKRYGTPLQANNGRDAIVDAYQEALDLSVYLRQAIEERAHTRAVAQAAAHASKDAVPKDLGACVAGARLSIDALRDAARSAGDGVLNFRERDRHVMALHRALDTLEWAVKNCVTAPLTPQRGASSPSG